MYACICTYVCMCVHAYIYMHETCMHISRVGTTLAVGGTGSMVGTGVLVKMIKTKGKIDKEKRLQHKCGAHAPTHSGATAMCVCVNA